MDNLTLQELHLHTKAVEERKLDQLEVLHFSAWLGLKVKATTGGKHPKYVYANFKKFFNRNKEKTEVTKDDIFSAQREYLRKKRNKRLKRKEAENGIEQS